MSGVPQYIGDIITVEAGDPATRIPLPALPQKGVGTSQIVRLYVRESGGPVELVSAADRTEGLPIPAQDGTLAFEAGTWRLGPGLTLYLYASSTTTVDILPVYEDRQLTGE